MDWWRDNPDEARYIVCSPKLKNILASFALPVHRFYNARVYSYTGFKMEKFFIFHFHFDFIREIILKETVFIERNQRIKSDIKRSIDKGYILTSEQFYLLCEEDREPLYWFYPDKLRFKSSVYYDLFSTQDGIVINEKVKKAIEEASLTGIEITEYTEYEILMES
jgi:hypothetical protein